MNTRKIASEYRLSHWAGVLQERNAGGMSVKEFCRTAGLRESVYYYWQRKLREAACEELAVQNAANGSERSLVPNGWAVCNPQSSKSVAIEIGGFRVLAEADSDPENLARVCRMLRTLC